MVGGTLNSVQASTGAALPLVIAHRGASGAYPEHTSGAYLRAIAEGADGLECDVRLTADGVIVCMHDRRIDRTSDGKGALSAKTYSELADRDYASWKRADERLAQASALARESAAGLQRESAERKASSALVDEDGEAPDSPAGLLRLDQLIDIALAAGRPLDLSIETKHPVRFGGLVEDRVVALLRRRDLLTSDSPIQVRMMSFSEVALRRVRELEPGLPTVLLMDRVPVRCRSGWLPGGARIAGLDLAILRAEPEYVARFHSAGSGVYVWVVDAPADVDLCLTLGVEAIITNQPGFVRSRMAARRRSGDKAISNDER